LEPTNYRLRELENQLAAAQRQLGQMEQRPAILRDGRNPRLAKTAIAPGAGSYPTEASNPNTYGIVFLDSTYTQASGNQARSDTARQTEARTVAQQLLPNTYVPVGTIVEVFWDSNRWWFAWGLSDTTILTPFYLDEDLLQGEDASATVIQWDPGTSTWTVSGDSITVWDVPNFGPADNGQRGWAIFGEGTSGRYEIISLPPSTGREIYRFRLTANLNLAGTATAKILEWDGAAYVLGDDIEVIDPFPAGRWSAKTAATGICAKIPDDARYNILWVEHQPIFAHFTLTGNMTGDSATATAYDYWQGPDGNDMWARAAVFDPLQIYGYLVTGDEVMCCWDDSLNQYKICDAKRNTNEIRWGYATADWVNAPLNASKVVCQLAAGKDGPSLGGAPFDVYLPRPSGSLDPNVREGRIIGFLPTVDGFFVCVTGHLDDCIGTIKIWSGAVADIRLGWQLCDGSNGTPDLREKFVLGAVGDSGGDSDFDEEGGNTYVGQTGGLKRKLVNWEHTAFGWPLLRTFDTTQYIFQYDSFQTEKEDPPLTVTVSGDISVSGAYTDFATANIEVRDPNNNWETFHEDHTHPLAVAEARADPDGALDLNDPNIHCTELPQRGGACGGVPWVPDHDAVEPGQAHHSDPGDQDPAPGDQGAAGHRHALSSLAADMSDLDADLHWVSDPYDGHYHVVQSGTLDGKLIIADVTHDAPAGVPYNRHYHDFHLDNHQEYINRIPPYYALAYIMRVD